MAREYPIGGLFAGDFGGDLTSEGSEDTATEGIGYWREAEALLSASMIGG